MTAEHTPRDPCGDCPYVHDANRYREHLNRQAAQIGRVALRSGDEGVQQKFREKIRDTGHVDDEERLDEIVENVRSQFIETQMQLLDKIDQERAKIDEKEQRSRSGCPDGVIVLEGRDAFGYTVQATLCGSAEVAREAGIEPALVDRDADKGRHLWDFPGEVT